MRQEIKDFLASKGITVELKGYTEIPASDGYNMRGTLYVNGKRAILCQDYGYGAGMEELDILNEKNAKPLLDLADEIGKKFKAYPGDEHIGDIPYSLDNMFYTLAEELLKAKAELKEINKIKKAAKTKTIFKWEDKEYEEGIYAYFNYAFDKDMLLHIIKKMKEKNHKTIEIFNFNNAWEKYTIPQLEKISKEFE